MKKQFFLNLIGGIIPEGVKDNENISVGDIKDFDKVKNEIEVLYVMKDDKSHFDLDINYVIFGKTNLDGGIIETYVRHPFISKIIEIKYTGDEGIMQTAKNNKTNVVKRLEETGAGFFHVTSVAYGKNGELIGAGTNSDYHLENGCIRKIKGCKSGEGYELCEGCQPLNHGERVAIKNVREKGRYEDLIGATAYMFGHYWACEPCTKALEKAGIKNLNISASFVKQFLNIQEF